VKFRDFLRVLAEHGFTQVRQRGSHRIFQGSAGGKTRVVVVAYHGEGGDIAPGTLKSMIRQSGLDKRFFR